MSEIKPLDEKIVQAKSDKLEKVLHRISVAFLDESGIQRTAKELEDIYSDEYRQMYSALYPILRDIREDQTDDGRIDCLLQNIEAIRFHIRDTMSPEYQGNAHYEEWLYGRLLKLSDHLSLEVQRMVDRENLISELEETKNIANTLDRKVRATRNKIARLQTESVVILGVFATIVIAFSGGVTILGAALGEMPEADPYKLTFTVLLCSIVLFNIAAYLMERMVKMVSNLNESRSSQNQEGWKARFKAFFRRKFQYWHVILFNVLMFTILLIDIWLWVNSGSIIT